MNPLKICPQCGTEYPANARFCEIDGTALRSANGNGDMVGSIVAERYHILKKLGEGGMGQVYLAEHVKMGRKSALKVMHPGMVKDVDAISRFTREASNASRISHPNVAAIYDFGETTDGVIYLAMEFVDGQPLTKLIEQTGALPAQRAAEIVRQTGEALSVAHDMGIVHRDLKPDNIMIAKNRDGDDLVKVVDFGIAKAAGNEAQKVTKTGLVVGTPEYMSPEQLAGDKLDGRSDIYALGLVAFNMLTGRLPFPAETAQESMIMRLTDKPRSLREMRSDVAWSDEVQQVMDRALERDTSKRYQTASDFGRDLARAIDRMPETAAASLGTQVIDLPPTRVAPPAPSGTSAVDRMATPPMTPSLTMAPSAPVSPALSASPPQRKMLVPVLGGISTVLIAVLVTLLIINNKSGKGTDASTTPTQAGTTTPPKNAASDSVAIASPTILSWSDLDQLAGDSLTAQRAIDGVIAQKLETVEDTVHAAFVRFRAGVQLGDAHACDALEAVAKLAPRTSMSGQVANRLAGCRAQ